MTPKIARTKIWERTYFRYSILILLMGCAPTYRAATLSTLAPKSRVTLSDSSRVDIRQPEIRKDSLYSQKHAPIPVDSIARVEAEQGASQTAVLGAVAGAILGLVVAHQFGGL